MGAKRTLFSSHTWFALIQIRYMNTTRDMDIYMYENLGNP